MMAMIPMQSSTIVVLATAACRFLLAVFIIGGSFSAIGSVSAVVFRTDNGCLDYGTLTPASQVTFSATSACTGTSQNSWAGSQITIGGTSYPVFCTGPAATDYCLAGKPLTRKVAMVRRGSNPRNGVFAWTNTWNNGFYYIFKAVKASLKNPSFTNGLCLSAPSTLPGNAILADCDTAAHTDVKQKLVYAA